MRPVGAIAGSTSELGASMTEFLSLLDPLSGQQRACVVLRYAAQMDNAGDRRGVGDERGDRTGAVAPRSRDAAAHVEGDWSWSMNARSGWHAASTSCTTSTSLSCGSRSSGGPTRNRTWK